MSDTPSSSGHVPPPIPPSGMTPGQPGVTGGSPTMSEKEIADGKTMAILSYALNFVNVPFWIIPLISRDNDYALYHAKQCLAAFVFMLPAAILAALSLMICIGVVLVPAVIITGLVLNVIGVMNASGGKCVPLPVIGRFGETWFAGMVKKAG